MITFDFIYETDSETDDGHRVIVAANMDEARAIFKAQVIAEGQKVRVGAIKGRKNAA